MHSVWGRAHKQPVLVVRSVLVQPVGKGTCVMTFPMLLMFFHSSSSIESKLSRRPVRCRACMVEELPWTPPGIALSTAREGPIQISLGI